MEEPLDRKAFDRLRLAANDFIRRFKGAEVRDGANLIRVTLTGTEKLVLQEVNALVRFDLGYAYPSRDYLAATCDCDLKVVKSAIKKVGQLGWFKITLDRRNNTYLPVWSKMVPPPTKSGPKNGPGPREECGPENPETRAAFFPDADRFIPESGPEKGPLSLLDTSNKPGDTTLPPTPPVRAAKTAGTFEEGDRAKNGPSFDRVFMLSGAAGPRGPALAQWNKLSAEDRIAVASFANATNTATGINTGGAWFSTWLKARGWEDSASPQVGITDPKVLQDTARSMERQRRTLAADVIGKADTRWRPIARKLQEQIGGDQLASWFGSVTLRSITASEITLETPSVFIRCEVEKRYRDALVRAARAADPDCTVTQARVVLAEPIREAAQ